MNGRSHISDEVWDNVRVMSFFWTWACEFWIKYIDYEANIV